MSKLNEYLSKYRTLDVLRLFGSLCVSFTSTHTAALTVPHAAVELHPKAHTHHPVSQGVEADHAGHNGRAQVFQHDIIGILIP